ncbi:hypothetical protein F53441_10946 [Fusarium austroafricanum]|uniref:Transcription factor domain-containing protein n=1 Tax=Fusarium austroafricanum TaxID=2364996 RepID=A0A8H4K9W1_9HYPO|nr:hypothetical protein F53441_10946 [Fusarium austroafricanum]
MSNSCQLHSIQNDLSDLASLVKSGSSVRSMSLPAEEWVPENPSGMDTATSSHTNRHIVRNTSQSLDRYHGPCSLYALCKEFHDDPMFAISEDNACGQNVLSEQMMLQEMLNEASNEPHFDMPSHPVGICLPPRQLLNLVVGPFFKNVDYATDVFVRSNFQPHIDRIYSQPIAPSDEGWAVGFNIIVLLGIKKEPTIQGNSHFAQTLLQTLKMAINNPRVFLTPRLVNVQALALLSYVAEQYSTTSLAELVFAQACLLAQIPDLLARLELAKLQDEVYQTFQAAGAPSLHLPRHGQGLAHLQQRLEQWASTYSVLQKSFTSTETFSLMLSFLATRICLSKGNDNMKSAQTFKDAKACCLVFLLATTAKPDLHLSEALKEILGRHKPRDQPSAKKAKRNSKTQPILSENDEITTSTLSRLAATFPLAAAFMVAKDILLQPIGEADDTPSRPEEEILLLEALRDRFALAADQAHIDNFALSFSRILGLLVRIVRQKRSPSVTPSMVFNELPSLHSTRSSSSLQGSVVSSFRDTPPGPENFSTPLDSPTSGSPWFGNASQNIGMNNTPVLVAWPGRNKRQSEEVDHLAKRPRISCHEEFLDIPPGYSDHGSRTEEDSLFAFDFLTTGADISVFDMEE